MQENEAQKVAGDFREFLQQEFIDRCRKNSRYSLRSFARSLKIQPSPLSAILRGKRPITEKTRTRLALALGMKPEEAERLGATKNQASEDIRISVDAHSIISDWYHFAILELIRVKSFQPKIEYVAKALGISRTETQIAVERLERVGLLKREKNRWIDLASHSIATNIQPNLTSESLRKLQRQVLEKSLIALDHVAIDYRDHTTMTLAINPKDLPAARVLIRNFRRELTAFLEKNSKPTHVYNISISLYPISKTEDL